VTEQAATEPGTEGGSLLVGYQMQTGYLREASLLHGAKLGYLHPLGPIELGVTADYGYSAYQTSDAFDVSLNQLVGAARLDFPFVSVQRLKLALGLSVGFGWGWQSARDTKAAPSVASQEVSRPFFRYLGHIVAELRLWGPLRLAVSGDLGQVVIDKEDGVAAPMTGGLTAGFALQL